MPQYAVLIYANDAPRPTDGRAATPREHDAHAAALTVSGTMRLAYALTGRSDAVAIHAGTERDGVLHDTPRIVVGFYVIDAFDFAAAIAIAHQNPAAQAADTGVEVRPVNSGGVTTPART